MSLDTRGVHVHKGSLAFALAISLAAASCTSDADPSAVSTTALPAVEGSSVPASEWLSLDDGMHHGIIEEMVLAEDGSLSVVVELIEVFGDQAAVDAAIEDGEASTGEDLPNPFYIRHLDVTGHLPLSDDAQLEVLDPLPGPLRPASADEFVALYNGALTPGPGQPLVPQPVEILIDDGVVTRLSQINTP